MSPLIKCGRSAKLCSSVPAFLREYGLEFAVLLSAVTLCGVMKPLVRNVILRVEASTLCEFEARGTIEAFDRRGRRMHLVIGYPGGAHSVKSRAFQLDSDVLRVGARFEKKAGTPKCLIDGKQYSLY